MKTYNDSGVTIYNANGGMFLTLLQVLFIGLKLGGINPVASWSWFWVLSPFLMPPVIGLGIFLIIGILVFLGLITTWTFIFFKEMGTKK